MEQLVSQDPKVSRVRRASRGKEDPLVSKVSLDSLVHLGRRVRLVLLESEDHREMLVPLGREDRLVQRAILALRDLVDSRAALANRATEVCWDLQETPASQVSLVHLDRQAQ